MFTTSIHLSTCRPSPTTVAYTVSNSVLYKTLSSRVFLYFTIVLRVLVCFIALATLTTKALFHYEVANPFVNGYNNVSGSNGQPLLIERVAISSSWSVIGPIGIALLFLCLRRFHTEESLLVLRSLGIQTSTTSSTYLSTSTTRFIPTSQIQDIFIHEAFKGFEVRYYLAVVVKDEAEVVVVFPTLLPRRAIVEEVWRGARACLFELKT